MIQLHKFMIGLVIVGLLVVGTLGFISSGVDVYEPLNYNETTTSEFSESYNKLTELSNQMEDFQGNEQNTTVNSNNYFDELTQPFDIVGNFFTGMYQSAKVFMSSADLVGSMIDDSSSKLPIGSYAGVLKTGLNIIVLIVVFVGIFLAFVTKSERT